MFCCLLKKELTFTLSRLETNNVSFSQVKFLVFEAQPVFSKLSEAAPLNERDRISITSTPSLHYRTLYAFKQQLRRIKSTIKSSRLIAKLFYKFLVKSSLS